LTDVANQIEKQATAANESFLITFVVAYLLKLVAHYTVHCTLYITMISNTASVPTLHGGYITLKDIKSKTQVKNRRTKIVCTMGPACWSEEGIATLMDAGMNVARFNFSHGDHEGHGAVLDRLRKVAALKSRNIAVLLDTKGPEIRSGFFADGKDKITLKKGDEIILTSDYSFKGNEHKLACSYEKLATSVKPGQQILVADGSLVLTVVSCDEPNREVTCKVENNATIGERKNMNLPVRFKNA
jgi:pyruvate kinase